VINNIIQIVLLFSLLIVLLYFFLQLVELIVCRIYVDVDVLHKLPDLFTEGLSNSDLRIILGVPLASSTNSQPGPRGTLLLNLIQFLHLLLDLPHVLNIFLLGALDLGLQVKELLLGVIHVLAVVLEVVFLDELALSVLAQLLAEFLREISKLDDGLGNYLGENGGIRTSSKIVNSLLRR